MRLHICKQVGSAGKTLYCLITWLQPLGYRQMSVATHWLRILDFGPYKKLTASPNLNNHYTQIKNPSERPNQITPRK